MKQKDYLNKVVEQLVSETNITGGVVSSPFPPFSPFFPSPFPPYHPTSLPPSYTPSSILTVLYRLPPFKKYCKDTYGLTEDEVKYVWDEYKNIMLNKINER